MTKPRKTSGGRNGPLSARSVVASTLLGMRPSQLPTRILVGSGALFGIAEGTTRVALSRMVAAGELVAEGDGYGLAGPMLTRQARQDASRRGTTRSWAGDWRMEVVVGDARPASDRTSLRAAAAALRLAELREGVWVRPDNLTPSALVEAEAVVADQCQGFTSRPRDEAGSLVGRLWDLDAWAGHGRALQVQLEQVVGPLEDGELDGLAEAFVLSASVLRHLQGDPLLPAELVPADWPGAALRADYERYDLAFKAVWRTWYHAQG